MTLNGEWAKKELEWAESVERVIVLLADGVKDLEERLKRLEEGKQA